LRRVKDEMEGPVVGASAVAAAEATGAVAASGMRRGDANCRIRNLDMAAQLCRAKSPKDAKGVFSPECETRERPRHFCSAACPPVVSVGSIGVCRRLVARRVTRRRCGSRSTLVAVMDAGAQEEISGAALPLGGSAVLARRHALRLLPEPSGDGPRDSRSVYSLITFTDCAVYYAI
jgi:hypothetical protein